MTNRMDSVYRRAHYYDIVFNRDVSSDVDFLVELFRTHAGRVPASVLDIACGPGYHARALARRGVRALGLDLRDEMIRFARDEAEKEGTAVEWLVGDMRDFTLAEPVDMMFTPFDAIDCLLTNDDIIEHFRCVARNLTPNGLYVVDLAHPRDCTMHDYGSYCWSGERDGVRVEVHWAVDRPQADPLTQVIEHEVVMRVFENGTVSEYRDRNRERFSSAQEYSLCARLSGALAVERFLGALSLDQPFDNSPGARRMVMVFRKAEA